MYEQPVARLMDILPPGVAFPKSVHLQFFFFALVYNSHYRYCVVVEDGRNVFGRKLVCCVADKETCFTDGTVADDNASVDAENKSALARKLTPIGLTSLQQHASP